MPEQRKLKAALVESGISQLEAADLLGITRESFNKKINGRVRFSLEEAFKIANFLKKPVEDIFLLKKFTQNEQKKQPINY